MPELSLQQIDKISHDISRKEISFSHLLEDLIDHVCCDVENEMQKGIDFPQAYRKVKQKMGSRRLKEIQEETLYAVDSKYRIMKNTMKISGIAGTVMFGFAGLFKIQHWPFAGIMLTLGAIILAFVFLPSAMGVLWKETHNQKRLLLFVSAFCAGLFFILGTLSKLQHWPFAGSMLSLAAISGLLFFIPLLTVSRFTDQENKSKRPTYILGALGMICYGIGMLFKIQHWPFASLLMSLGVFLLCVLALPLYTWNTWKEEKYISARFIFLIVGMLAILIPGMMINLNLQNSYNDGYYANQSQQQTLFNFRYNTNQSFLIQYHDSLNHIKMEQLHSKTGDLLSIINKVQIQMIEQSEGDPNVSALNQIKQTENGPEIQYKNLSKPFQTGLVSEFLLPGCKSREELNIALSGYLSSLSGFTTSGNLSKCRSILDPSIYLPSETSGSDNISLMSGLHSLELLKNGLLTIESFLLSDLAQNTHSVNTQL